jgi:2-methylcitrate dehydratase PrpD
MTADAIHALCRHAVRTRFEDLPAAALDAARIFILDSLGVGVAGSRGPYVDELIAAHAGVAEARVLGRDVRLPASASALVNAYQIHNSEFDCVHEGAVVHPMAVPFGTLLAWVDREARAGRRVAGRELMAAVILGVDVACHVGVASRAPLRFFRPATAGALGATAAVGRLAGFDTERLVGAMGISYAQMGGTMQAHVEGSPVLAMQAGFNARNALVACDLAARGISGPRNVLEGPFGYLALFEGEHDMPAVLDRVGRAWRIAEVAHKPFPSGRATHGIVDACLALAREHGFSGHEVASVEARVPPLTHRLVGRRPAADMSPNYARLCAAYVAARALLGGAVTLDDFDSQSLRDEATLELAHRVHVDAVAHPDPNALTPVAVTVELADGARHERTLDVVYGNPANPLTREAHLQKFRRNCHASAGALDERDVESAISCVDSLEACDDASQLLAWLTPRGSA